MVATTSYAQKFGRNYFLTIQKADLTSLIVTPPLTIEFDITRTTLSSSNICQIKIYNLNENHRNALRKNACDFGVIRGIELQAGYGKSMPTVFKGNYTQAYSSRVGVNYVTVIECYAGGFSFANAQSNRSYASGSTLKAGVIADLMGDLGGGITVGAIGSFPGTVTRGATYSGATMSLLAELTGGGVFIDNGVAHCLGTNEYILGNTSTINSMSGLLGTPRLEQTTVSFDMIFEPRLVVGSKIDLQSSTLKAFNGQYKITSVKHRGMISEAKCGEVITTAELFYTQSQLVGIVPFGN